MHPVTSGFIPGDLGLNHEMRRCRYVDAIFQKIVNTSGLPRSVDAKSAHQQWEEKHDEPEQRARSQRAGEQRMIIDPSENYRRACCYAERLT